MEVLMLILPESVARQDGASPDFPLGADCGKPLLLRLGITRTMEQESLEISVWGSSDKGDWDLLQSFPQKFYCGTYSLVLDLGQWPHVRYLRATWKMNRWGHGKEAPLFGFYLSTEDAKLHAVGA